MSLFWDSGIRRYNVIPLSRYIVIPSYRYFGIIVIPQFSNHISRPIASRIVAAAPELPAGVDAFLCHALDHRLAALGAGGSICLDTLLSAVSETFGGKPFGKATLSPERF